MKHCVGAPTEGQPRHPGLGLGKAGTAGRLETLYAPGVGRLRALELHVVVEHGQHRGVHRQRLSLILQPGKGNHKLSSWVHRDGGTLREGQETIN